jgi:hypothetical protein
MVLMHAVEKDERIVGLISGETKDEIEQKAKELKLKLYGVHFPTIQSQQYLTKKKRKKLYGF